MQESTKQKYRKDASSFYTKYGLSPYASVSEILACLNNAAHDYQPKSFSNIKLYLAFDQQERGHHHSNEEIRGFRNPAVDSHSYPKKKGRVKTLSTKDIKTIGKALPKNSLVSYATIVVLYLGCRPSEILKIRHVGPGRFFIKGSKKYENERGLDRCVRVRDQDEKFLIKALDVLKDANIKKIQDQFAYRMKKAFPRRKKRPTLYSFRHQLGSDLKASGKSREEIAYIMGHQSTRTIENYGYIQSGRGRSIDADISIDAINGLVRDSHTHREQDMDYRLTGGKMGAIHCT